MFFLILFICFLILFIFILHLFKIISMKQKLPIHCPSCSSSLLVSQLSCSKCTTLVSGNYVLPTLLQLTEDEQQFVYDFFLTSGSLKEMAVKMGNSYPTVRNRLDDIIEKIKELEINK
jgi:hypothetical protein